ncbi:hypothetical protein ACXZ9C_10730 [Streptococcus agalactiae]
MAWLVVVVVVVASRGWWRGVAWRGVVKRGVALVSHVKHSMALHRSIVASSLVVVGQ